MSKFIFILVFLMGLSSSSAIAGDKLYNDDDLEKYRYPSDSQSGETNANRNPGILDRISYFDITDIDIKIDQLKEKIKESKKDEEKEIDKKCISVIVVPNPRVEWQAIFSNVESSDVACAELIRSKYDKYRENISQQILILIDRQNRLKQLYELQEQKKD